MTDSIHPDSPWTDEKVEKLRAGWAAGDTTAVIAAGLGEGCTKNSVIGKAHRLGLPSRPSPIIGRKTPISVWTDEVVAKLRALVADGLSPSMMANRLGLSYEQVAGKLRRLDLDGLTAPAARQGGKGEVVRPEFTAAQARAATPLPLNGERACQWPMWGDNERPGSNPPFCGEPVTKASSPRPERRSRCYCAKHYEIAWVPVRDRREGASVGRPHGFTFGTATRAPSASLHDQTIRGGNS